MGDTIQVQVVDLEDDGKLVQAHVPNPCRGNSRKRAISVEQYNPIEKPIFDLSSLIQEIKKPRRSVKVKRAPWTEVLSDHPRASIYHNFLNEKQCQHLITLGTPKLQRSRVKSPTDSQGVISSNRTSFGASIPRGADKIIRGIEKRISEITSIPIEKGESLQVLKYEVGQKFEAHYDYDDKDSSYHNGGPRMATFLIYLSNVEEGGETVFPQGIPKSSSVPNGSELNMGKIGISVKPKMGDAFLFWSMKPDGTRDPASLHSGSPVLKGNKWSCTKWLHVHRFY